MTSKEDAFDANDTVGVWCELTLVNDVKLEGLVYSYNPEKKLIVLLQENEKESAKILNTNFIKKFDVKKADSALPGQLTWYSVLPSMLAGKGKSLIKSANSTLSEAEKARTANLVPLKNSDASIGAFDVFVAIKRIFPGIEWENSSSSIKCSSSVYIEGNPTWETPAATIKSSEKPSRDDTALLERIQQQLENLLKQ